MKSIVDGKVVEMTEEMIKEMDEVTASLKEITDKQRISALESAISDLAVMLVGGVNNGWVH